MAYLLERAIMRLEDEKSFIPAREWLLIFGNTKQLDSFNRLFFCKINEIIGSILWLSPGANSTAAVYLPITSLFLFPVNKISPRNSIVPDQGPHPSDLLGHQQQHQTTETPTPTTSSRSHDNKSDPFKPPTRSGACRVCLKSFKADDFSITCYECQQRVCEDCASYSKLDVNEDMVSVRIDIGTENRTQPKRTDENAEFFLLAFSSPGGAACAVAKCPPAYVCHRIPPIRYWTYRWWIRYSAATPMWNWARAAHSYRHRAA